jgi:Gpi18-like mannosyltransferase
MANAELDAAELRARDWPSLNFSFAISGIWPLLLAGLIFRLVLQTLPHFESDINLFQFWADNLAADGPVGFYDREFFSDYAPGYMYVLLVIGKLHDLFNFSEAQYEYILKLPATIADLASVYLLWRFLDGQRPAMRYLAAVIYLVFPPALLIGPVWGQIDSFLAFFLLLSIYFIARDRPLAGAVAYTVGFLVKPQAIAALPFLAFWIMKQNPPRWTPPNARSMAWSGACALAAAGLAITVPLHLGGLSGAAIVAFGLGAAGAAVAGFMWYTQQIGPDTGHPAASSADAFPIIPRLWLQIASVCLAVMLLGLLPFFELRPWDFYDHLKGASEVYQASSFWAYNFWGVVGGMDALPGNFADHLRSGGFPFVNDDSQWFGIDYRYWGVALTAVALLAVCAVVARVDSGRTDVLALGTALSVMAFYLFMTRMHERYLFQMFLPMLAACALAHSRILWGLFLFLAITHFFNLYYVYSYYQLVFTQDDLVKNEPAWTALYNWIEDRAFLISLLMTLCFPVLLAVAYRLGLRPHPKPEAA